MEYTEIIINMILLCMALIMAFHGVRNYIQYRLATKIWKELDDTNNFKNRQ